MTTLASRLVEAITSVVGRELSALSGYRFTRLTAPVVSTRMGFRQDATTTNNATDPFCEIAANGFPDGTYFWQVTVSGTSAGGTRQVTSKGTFTVTAGVVSVVTILSDTVAATGDGKDWTTAPNVSGNDFRVTVSSPAGDGVVTWAATATIYDSTTAPVESTFGWPSSGKVIIAGDVHTYRGTTATSLTGLEWADEAGTVTWGAKTAYAPASVVLDYNKVFAAVEQIAARVFVDEATGEALSIFGRALGVKRAPTLTDDEIFRKIIKNLAFVPKGTILTLTRLLEAIFGVGNFEVWEQFPAFPNKVFIRITNGYFLSGTSAGRGFLTRRERKDLTVGSKQIALPATPLAVSAVRLADESLTTEFPNLRPSTVIETRYPGDAGLQAWEFVAGGATEATWAVPSATNGGVVTLKKTLAAHTPRYRRTARILPETDHVEIGISFSHGSGTLSATRNSFAVGFENNNRMFAVGVYSTAGAITFAFINRSTSAVIGTAFVATGTNGGDLVDMRVVREGGRTNLYVSIMDDATGTMLYQSVLAASVDDDTLFPASTANEFFFGMFDTTTSIPSVRVKRVWVHASTKDRDFWNHRLSGTTVSDTTIDVVDATIDAVNDIGRHVRVRANDSPVTSKHSGRFLITGVAGVSPNFTLTLGDGVDRALGEVTAGDEPSFRVPTNPFAFTFPDDVGKKLRIPSGPNAGTWVIASVVDAGGDTLTDYGHGPTVTLTGSPGTWVTETGIVHDLLPDMTAAKAVELEISNVGSQAGATLTLRQIPALVDPGTLAAWRPIVDVDFSMVRSGQVLQGTAQANNPVGTFAPLYLPPDPLGPLSAYLKELTAAGVIPEVLL
jgi:hypothetical protein